MCPISPGQANNDWKAIEVKQTDNVQLVIAVFASLSTCEEVSGKTQQGCHFSFRLHLPLGTPAEFLPEVFAVWRRRNANNYDFVASVFFLFIFFPLFDVDLRWPTEKPTQCINLVISQFAWLLSAAPSVMFVFPVFEARQVNRRSFCTAESRCRGAWVFRRPRGCRRKICLRTIRI